MRATLALLLALILSLTSLTEAVARSEMAGATSQAICGDAELLIDATGKPIAAHPCTHCLAASVAATLTAAPALARPLTRALVLRPQSAKPAQSRPLPKALARGPPAALT